MGGECTFYKKRYELVAFGGDWFNHVVSVADAAGVAICTNIVLDKILPNNKLKLELSSTIGLLALTYFEIDPYIKNGYWDYGDLLCGLYGSILWYIGKGMLDTRNNNKKTSSNVGTKK